MKQSFGLIIAALASAATASAQTPSYQGALVISRMSLPSLSRAPCSLLKIMHSLRKQRKVSDIPKWVSTISVRIIATSVTRKNKNKSLVVILLVTGLFLVHAITPVLLCVVPE